MEPDISFVGAGIRRDQVNPIHQKRLLAFVNFWLSRTVGFLNSFAGQCEEKLTKLELHLQRIDTSLTLLEAKLTSIPGLEDASLNVTTQQLAETIPTEPVVFPSKPIAPAQVVNESVPDEPNPQLQQEHSVSMVKDDPHFQKYFKMIKMGVPIDAIKQKVIAEGMDPSFLDNPDAPVTQYRSSATNVQNEEDSDMESDSSFSSDD